MKILVVEDDRKIARLLQRVLEAEAYSVLLCASGAEALQHAKSGQHDLVLLDWMIPDLDGVEVCRQLRRIGSRIPILMLTARGDLSERVLGLDAGADDYLVKPFQIRELTARVAALLRRTSGHPHLKLGPLEIDRHRSRVHLDGALVDLTAREFRLLLHLAYHEGQVVSRDELRTEVWGLKFDTESNIVETQMSRLREKLGAHSEMIETLRGRGYRLKAPR